MNIAGIEIGERPLVLAPMEDVTNPPFRQFCKKFGADWLYSEFVSADALIVSTPVYFGQASWAYRIFEDRMYAFLDKGLKSDLPKGKDLVIIVSYSSDRAAAERIAEHIRHLMVDIFGFRHVGTMIYCDHSRTTSAKDDDEACRIAVSLGTSLQVAVPFDNHSVVSMPEDDARRGNTRLEPGFVWKSQ